MKNTKKPVTKTQDKKPQAQKPKRRNYKKELGLALKQIEELKDQLLRAAAEFDNFRKRSNNEKSDLILQANADMISSLLPVLDDFERFFLASQDSDAESLRQGTELIFKNFQTILADHGLSAMSSIGQPFDPERHDALMQIDAKDAKPDTVIDEPQKGYEFNGRVVRHAKVVVSK